MGHDLVNKVVLSILRKHPGGEEFFDELDETLRKDESILKEFFELMREEFRNLPDGKAGIIASGRFGSMLQNYMSTRTGHFPYFIVVNGNLRHGDPVDDLSYLDNLAGRSFLFVDDSFYKGRTRDAINAALSKYGAEIAETLVIYDGSKQKFNNVKSMYRYHS